MEKYCSFLLASLPLLHPFPVPLPFQELPVHPPVTLPSDSPQVRCDSLHSTKEETEADRD